MPSEVGSTETFLLERLLPSVEAFFLIFLVVVSALSSGFSDLDFLGLERDVFFAFFSDLSSRIKEKYRLFSKN